MYNRTVLATIAIVSVFIVQVSNAHSSPSTDNLPNVLKGWTIPNHSSECRYVNTALSPFEPSGNYPRSVTGRDNMSSANSTHSKSLMEYIGSHMDYLVSGRSDRVETFIAELEANAKQKTFTVPDFGSQNGGSSPKYVQTLILINLAYAVSYLDQTGLAYNRVIVDWGNDIESKLYGRGVSSLDSLAARSAARLMWSTATNQHDIFRSGVSDFNNVMSTISSDGEIISNEVKKYVPDFKNVNINVSYLVLAAEIMERNGVAAYSEEYGWSDKTLKDAVKLFTTKYAGDNTFLKSEGYLHHYGWAPIYVQRNPDDENSKTLQVQIASKGKFFGLSIGGNTSCLWGHKVTDEVKNNLKPEENSNPCSNPQWANMFPKMCGN
jgi:hypothetical protein